MSELRLIASVVAVILSLLVQPSFSRQQDASKEKGDAFTVVGRVSSEDLASTSFFRIAGKHGLLIVSGGVWVSDDAGANWKQIAVAGEHGAPASFDASWAPSERHILIISGGVLFETNDLGGTWRRRRVLIQDGISVNGNLAGTWLVLGGQRRVRIAPSRLSSVPKYAEDVTSSSRLPRMLVPTIMFSSNDGQTWTPGQLPKAIGYVAGFVVSDHSAIAWGPYLFLMTVNRGKTWLSPQWMSIPEEEDAYPVSAAISGNIVWASLKNGILLTGTLQRRHLQPISRSSSALNYLTFVTPCVGFALRNDDIVKTSDGGINWSQMTHLGNVHVLSRTNLDIFGLTDSEVVKIGIRKEQLETSCASSPGH